MLIGRSLDEPLHLNILTALAANIARTAPTTAPFGAVAQPHEQAAGQSGQQGNDAQSAGHHAAARLLPEPQIGSLLKGLPLSRVSGQSAGDEEDDDEDDDEGWVSTGLLTHTHTWKAS